MPGASDPLRPMQGLHSILKKRYPWTPPDGPCHSSLESPLRESLHDQGPADAPTLSQSPQSHEGSACSFPPAFNCFLCLFFKAFRSLASSGPGLYGGPYSALMAPEYREEGRHAGQHHWNTSREVGNPNRKTTTPSASGATGTDLAKFSDFAPVLEYWAIYRRPIGSLCAHAAAMHTMIRWRSRTASAILLLPLTSRGC